jgi:Rrf2 family protein
LTDDSASLLDRPHGEPQKEHLTMIFTTKAEYGVRLLVELGRQADDAPVSLKAIAEAEGLPLAYLERIVALLKKQGLVESTRGAHGGYRLARPASDITMDEAVLALEGAVAPMSCFVDDSEDGRVLCSHVEDGHEGCATRLLWTRVQGGVTSALQRTTLQELVDFGPPRAVDPPVPAPVGATLPLHSAA